MSLFSTFDLPIRRKPSKAFYFYNSPAYTLLVPRVVVDTRLLETVQGALKIDSYRACKSTPVGSS